MNKFDFEKFLLFALIFTFPLSSKFVLLDLGFINLYAYRIILLISLGYLFYKNKLYFPKRSISGLLIIFSIYLLVYGGLSLLWVDGFSNAIKGISYTSWGLLTIIVLISLLNNVKNSLKEVSKAWLYSFIFLSIFGIVEVSSSIHFNSSFIKHLESFDFVRNSFNSPLATFANPNDFAVFLIFTLVIFFMKLPSINIFSSLLISFVTMFLVIHTRSNIAKFSSYYILIIGFLILMISNQKLELKKQLNFVKIRFSEIKNDKASFASISLLIAFSIIFVLTNNQIVILQQEDSGRNFEYIEVEKSPKGVENIALNIKEFYSIDKESVAITQTESFNVRKNLLINGWKFAKNSYFMGIGAGQYEFKTSQNQQFLPTQNKINPHSFFIEVFAQYGIIPILILGLFFVSILLKLIKNFSFLYIKNNSIEANFLLLVIPVYLLLSNAPSAFKSHPINWIILSLIAFSADKVFDNIKSKSNA